MKSLINSEVLPFNATAFHAGKFVAVSDADLRGKLDDLYKRACQ